MYQVISKHAKVTDSVSYFVNLEFVYIKNIIQPSKYWNQMAPIITSSWILMASRRWKDVGKNKQQYGKQARIESKLQYGG